MPNVGVQIIHVWDIGTTGLSGTISDTLTRYPTAASETAAAETVAIAEIGSSGVYTATYTPLNQQTYQLKLAESTLYIEKWFEDSVGAAPTTATASDAYCSEADVVSYVQMGDYTASTIPTETQVLTFMANRAGELYGLMSDVAGKSTPGPSGYNTSIDTSTDAGTALSRALRQSNAMGAAADALEAAGAGESPARSERVAELMAAYTSSLGGILSAIKTYINLSHETSRTHVSKGWTSSYSPTTTATPFLPITGTTKF